ncbi:hypothetical protein ACR79T_15660 [Sphingobacterium spiritivorum]|uniref:hypothetical protein n=1 Tax=Sphingobacterium spiritivorum TaxID=258 RepID=UPI003DA1E406
MTPVRLLAEDYYSTTTYTYVENNLIGYIDPTGMYKVDANGNISIDDADEIENFVKFLNSNQGATYKDIEKEFSVLARDIPMN